MNRTFRPATEADQPQILAIIAAARRRMGARGSEQWQGAYPAPEDIARDIQKNSGWVLGQKKVAAYGAVIFDPEPAYAALEGQWLDEEPYVVVHRLAVAEEDLNRGLATQFIVSTENLARSRGVKSFRVDTNFDNLPMQRVLEKLGFTYCGQVMYHGSPRIAYHKKL